MTVIEALIVGVVFVAGFGFAGYLAWGVAHLDQPPPGRSTGGGSTSTVIWFDADPATDPIAGGTRFVAPAAGWYRWTGDPDAPFELVEDTEEASNGDR